MLGRQSRTDSLTVRLTRGLLCLRIVRMPYKHFVIFLCNTARGMRKTLYPQEWIEQDRLTIDAQAQIVPRRQKLKRSQRQLQGRRGREIAHVQKVFFCHRYGNIRNAEFRLVDSA